MPGSNQQLDLWLFSDSAHLCCLSELPMSPRFSSSHLDNKPQGSVSGFILYSVDQGGLWLCGISGDSGQDAQSWLARLWVGPS